MSSWTGPQLAGLGLNIVALPREALASLGAAQIAALSPVQASALASRMAAPPPAEGTSSAPVISSATSTMPDNPASAPGLLAGVQAKAIEPPQATLDGVAAQPVFSRASLDTSGRAIEVMPQIADKALTPGEMLYQLVQTGTGNAGLQEFLAHHLAPEAVGLVAARQVSGKTDLAHSVQELFAQAVNAPVSLASMVEDRASATCRAVLGAAEQANAARVFEGVILLSLNPSGRIDQLSFIDDHLADRAHPPHAT